MKRKSLLFSKHFCAFILVVFIQNVVAAIQPPPPVGVGYEPSENMVIWARKVLGEVSENHGLAEKVLKNIGDFIQYLEGLSVAQVEKNHAHFDHLQKLKNCEFTALYWYGVHHLEHEAWKIGEIEAHLNQLRARNATPEFELVFLKALKWWPDFYTKQREVLEFYEAYPKNLNLPVPIPPQIYELDQLPVQALHDITVIIDISLKYYWKPELEEFESLLMKLAGEFEKKQSFHYAYEALELSDPKTRSSKITQYISELKNKAKSASPSKSSKSLY